MVKDSSRALLGALLLALVPSCLGGQTGQPSLDTSCDPVPLAADERWHERTSRQLAEPFAATFGADLRWFRGPVSSQAEPVAFEDAVTVTVGYEGVPGTLVDCRGVAVDIPVSIEVVTTGSGLVEHGSGTLRFTDAMDVSSPTLTFAGEVVSLDGVLTSSEGSVRGEGELEPQVAGAPGDWADFP